ncbi:MAG: hypothetical protein ACR2JC_16785 [Chloroflexota bacterium]
MFRGRHAADTPGIQGNFEGGVRMVLKPMRWFGVAVVLCGSVLASVGPSGSPTHAASGQVHVQASSCGKHGKRRRAASVGSFEGHLQLKSPRGKWHSAKKKKFSVYVKDRLRTREGQRAVIQWCDGATTRMNQNSLIHITGLHKSRLDRGEAEAVQPAQGQDSIQAGHGSSKPVAGTATIIDVKTNQTDATFVSVLGASTIADAQGTVVVGAGLQTTVKPHAPPKAPQPADVASVTNWTNALPATPLPPGTTGTWEAFGAPGQFDGPHGVAVDLQGDTYVTDEKHARVVKLAPGGHQVATWGSPGSGPGQFDHPQGVAVDGEGNVDVVDSGNDRVQKFSSNGDFILQFGGNGTGLGRFNGPSAIAADLLGNLYVVDTGNNLVQTFASDGSYRNEFGGTGAAPGKFQGPSGVAVDALGTIYVADRGNWRVQKLSSLGQPIAHWGGHGNAPGQFTDAAGVALDIHGGVFVADGGRMKGFSPAGIPLG